MGKPLGMGAVAIKPSLSSPIVRRVTKRCLAAEQWETGVQTAEPQPFLDALNRYLLQEQGLRRRGCKIVAELERHSNAADHVGMARRVAGVVSQNALYGN
jgi:hypothetical protein